MAAVGLLIAIVVRSTAVLSGCTVVIDGFVQLSAIFTRKSNDPNLFVRTSLVFYFVSALACEALSGAYLFHLLEDYMC